jgi:DNA-binding XRE family transcriptional regulator
MNLVSHLGQHRKAAVPSTVLALKLARHLAVPVEALFALPEGATD